ncbi:hypothetical protein EDD21DRAFT_381417 [Dissophora ornata]|nr:hypothetical protein EDD21DRAFT_381417 [Dissophora ornata]
MTLDPSLTPLPLPAAKVANLEHGSTSYESTYRPSIAPQLTSRKRDGADIDATTTTTELLDMILDAPSEQVVSWERSEGSDSETELESATLINANSPPPAEVPPRKKRERLRKGTFEQRFGQYERQLMNAIIVSAKALEDCNIGSAGGST